MDGFFDRCSTVDVHLYLHNADSVGRLSNSLGAGDDIVVGSSLPVKFLGCRTGPTDIG